jgi:hypothetical protein
MPEPDVIDRLVAGRELGLDQQRLDAVDRSSRAALEREFARDNRRSGRLPRRRWRGTTALVGAVLVAGIAATGYAALSGSSSTASDGIGCYDGARLNSNVAIVSLDGRAATKTCAELWENGDMGDGARQAPAPLHACVSSEGDGPIAVLPSASPEICERVGLEEDPFAGADPDAREFGQFMSQLDPELERLEGQCPTRGELKGLVETLLRRHGLTGWTFNDLEPYRPGDCAELALDSDARVVTLVFSQP